MKNKIYLYNTLGKEKQEFVPIRTDMVRLYSCGPTVYNFAHIGNLRAYVFVDTLKRVLKYNGLNVLHIMNITDVGHLTGDDSDDSGDDKMVKALVREGKKMTLENMRIVANFYFERFKEDLDKLNIISPNEYPFASDNITEDEEMIKILIDKGYAYKTKDGIYFDTSKDSNYGILGGTTNDNQSRIIVNSEKKNPKDFALWKFSNKDDSNAVGFGSDEIIGKGFPGWHIECSAMSLKYLGVPFDIHTGGVDHISIHHNNEIAQTECSTGKKMANFWIHNEHITIDSDKMAKSGDNFITLNTLIEKGIDPLAYRYWLLTSRYSTRVDFSFEAVLGAQVAYNKLQDYFSSLVDYKPSSPNDYYMNKFIKYVNDDLDTPKAIALVWDLIKSDEITTEVKKATLIEIDKVLGLKLGSKKNKTIDIPEEVSLLLDQRKNARTNNDWNTSDTIREKIQKLGFKVTDVDNDQKIDRIY